MWILCHGKLPMKGIPGAGLLLVVQQVMLGSLAGGLAEAQELWFS